MSCDSYKYGFQTRPARNVGRTGTSGSHAPTSLRERSEVLGGAQLATLRRAAAALDCTLIYAFMPRTSLERTMFDQAVAVAKLNMGPASEGEDKILAERITHVAGRLVDSGRVWDAPTLGDLPQERVSE